MPVVQSTQNHVVSQNLTCSIDLTFIREFSRGADTELAQECSDMINLSYTVQMQADALTKRLKFAKAGSLERYHAELLEQKESHERELSKLQTKKWELDREQSRASGRMQQARTALSNHRSAKLSPKLTKKSDLIRWEETERSLSAKVDEAQREQSDLNLMYADHNHDVETVGNMLRVTMAEIELAWNRLQRLRGSTEAHCDPATGLAS